MRRRENGNADDGKSGREYQLTKELMFGKKNIEHKFFYCEKIEGWVIGYD